MQTGQDADKDAIDFDAVERLYEEERLKRLRSDGMGQYQHAEGRLKAFAADPLADPDFTRDPVTEEVDALIVGGGFGGLLNAGRLSNQGVRNIRIVEKGADFGGTWYWNRYPGAACDVESYIYLPLLEELGYMPTEKYARGSEIHAHCQRIAKHFDLYPKALFQTAVNGAVWDAARGRWIVTTDRGDTIAARFLISCIGMLSTPRLPGIPGIEQFEGHAFHTSRWDYAYTGGDGGPMTGLADKTVGLIGTGATGVQCIPHIARAAKHLFVIQRTPSTIDRRDNRPTDPEWAAALPAKWASDRRDNFTIITAGGVVEEDLIDDGWTELSALLAGRRDLDGNAPAAEMDEDALRSVEMLKMEQTRQRIADTVTDPETARALQPFYHYMCKRPCFSDDYLETFNRPNVTLLDTDGQGVERITRNGVVIAGREHKLDCLVFATGFDFMSGYVHEAGFDITGPDGVTLSEHWKTGARTLYGMQTNGFPNFMMVSYVQAGASINYVHIADEQASHIAFMIAKCLKEDIRTIQPMAEAEDAWVDEVLTSAGPRREFLKRCTPGLYNFEGQRNAEQSLNDIYGGDPMAYLARLRDWRAAGTLDGMKVERAG